MKPENVVLMSTSPDSPVKLIDLGAAVLLEEGAERAERERAEMYLGAAVLLEEGAAPPPLARLCPSVGRRLLTPRRVRLPTPPAGEQAVSRAGLPRRVHDRSVTCLL